jgi:hypothetical protein
VRACLPLVSDHLTAGFPACCIISALILILSRLVRNSRYFFGFLIRIDSLVTIFSSAIHIPFSIIERTGLTYWLMASSALPMAMVPTGVIGTCLQTPDNNWSADSHSQFLATSVEIKKKGWLNHQPFLYLVNRLNHKTGRPAFIGFAGAKPSRNISNRAWLFGFRPGSVTLSDGNTAD